ncbi:Rieske (2Fe-2S) protein [Pseudonocardia bannensis]|uniref:Rieske 2Fe-2S domain-containing protein n=1 Tax=Pseudonocardia bannensis TaxID=630973 RepID=A0A848DK95_9PSEU|nr:Rieske 2Fe-2S domain-containing protein [Pseudonocardia bannensis]NMH92891.1 Rieske 2Fe-2S domain-containing protein [Pseudonocardia bannensis]
MTERAALRAGWIPVCPTEQLATDGRAAVDLPSGERCLVFNVEGALYAVSATCSHRALSIEGGPVQGTTIVCPWHKARFDMATGKGTRPAREPLKTFAVAVIDGTVCVHEKEGE